MATVGTVVGIFGAVLFFVGLLGVAAFNAPTIPFVGSFAGVFGLGRGGEDVILPSGGINVNGHAGQGYKGVDLAMTIGGAMMIAGGAASKGAARAAFLLLGIIGLILSTLEVWGPSVLNVSAPFKE